MVVKRFVAAARGLGLGDREERLVLLNAQLRDDRSFARFGDFVGLRSRLAKEKFLGTLDDEYDECAYFTRNLVGAAERWELVPGTVSRRRGDIVRSGDTVSLRNARNDGFLAGESDDATRLSRELSQATAWQVVLAGAPYWPTWHDERPHLSGQFLVDDARGGSSGDDLALDRAAVADEPGLVDDILSALAGCDGGSVRVVVSSKGDIQFELDNSSHNLSLAQLARRCLPTGQNFVRVRNFVRSRMRYEFGRVAHAFAAEIRIMLREYLTFLAQVETKALSVSARERRELGVQQLWFWLQPAAKRLGFLDRVCTAMKGRAGGQLLDALLEFPTSDDEERSILDSLCEASAKPYLEMLAQWICRGHLDDPYGEFLVTEDQTTRRDDVNVDFNAVYWESRFSPAHARAVGKVLKAKAELVTVTGKYWHVVRELRDSDSSFVVSPPANEDVVSDESFDSRWQSLRGDDDVDLGCTIDAAHSAASTALLELVFVKERALSCIVDLKRFFLGGQGDFLVNFLDLATPEMEKRIDLVDLNRLDSLLQLCLHSPSIPLKASLADSPLVDHLESLHAHDLPSFSEKSSNALFSGADAFVLDVDVAWPLSIVISRRCVVKYQLVFRLVFRLKRVGRSLLDAWTDQMATKDAYGSFARKSLGRAFCLRHRMLHFVQTLTGYVMFDVVETRHRTLVGKLSSQLENLDQALTDHDNFLDLVLRECLLTHHALFSLVADMLAAADRFAAAAKRFNDAALASPSHQYVPAAENSFKKRQVRLDLRKAQLDRTARAATNYFDLVRQQTEAWSALSSRFLDRLLSECHMSYNSHLLDLYNRLHRA